MAKGREAMIFAPHKKEVKGSPSFTCIGIRWKNMNRYTSATRCKTIAREVRNFFDINSRGLVKIDPDGFSEAVELNAALKNVAKAENIVIPRHKADMHGVINNIRNFSNAGLGVAHLKNDSIRTAQHEVGHLLGLGHAGAYDRAGVLDHYGDRQSVMGRYPSPWLTAPQYYNQGWMPEEEAVIGEPGVEYELKKVIKFEKPGISTVIVPREGRNLYFSFPPGGNGPCVAMHLDGGEGSQRIVTFSQSYTDKRFTKVFAQILPCETPGAVRFKFEFIPE